MIHTNNLSTQTIEYKDFEINCSEIYTITNLFILGSKGARRCTYVFNSINQFML